MLLHITQMKYLGDYKIEVFFNNGKKGIADVSPVLSGPAFEPLKDRSLFCQCYLDEELGTIAWPNGTDLAPEYVYFETFRNDPELQEQFKRWGYIA